MPLTAASPPSAMRALRLRMAFCAAVLALVYFVFISLLVVCGLGAIAVAVVAALACVAHYFASDRVALAAARARPVSRGQAPIAYEVLERLCDRAGLGTPSLVVSPVSAANAFTVGRTPSTATICVTRGLLESLDEPELEAVLAHELAHVASRDVMVMTLAGVFASLAALAVQTSARRRGGGEGREHRPTPLPVVIAADLVYLISYAMVWVVSRERELVADRAAAELTGDPDALAAALAVLGRPAPEDADGLAGELSPFTIVVPTAPDTVATMFETHPPLTARLSALSSVRATVAA